MNDLYFIEQIGGETRVYLTKKGLWKWYGKVLLQEVISGHWGQKSGRCRYRIHSYYDKYTSPDRLFLQKVQANGELMEFFL